MPALANPRQERFCQLLKQGIPARRAYPLAGYNAHGSAPYRLCANVRIKRRIRELTRHIAVKTRVTIESLTEELDAVKTGATAAEQYGAARAAIETKAKLHGLLVDRKESGQPGDFAGLQSAEEVLDLVRKELGDETAALLAAALGRREAETVDELAEVPAIDGERDAGSTLN